MRERTHQDRLRRQDLLADRLEGRLRLRRAAAVARAAPRRTSSSPSPRRPICRSRSPMGSARPMITSSTMRKDLARSRDRLASGLKSIGFPVHPLAGHLFSHRRSGAARAQRDRRGVLQADRHRLQGRGDSGLGLLRSRTRSRSVVRFCFAKKDADARHRAGAAVGRGASTLGRGQCPIETDRGRGETRCGDGAQFGWRCWPR